MNTVPRPRTKLLLATPKRPIVLWNVWMDYKEGGGKGRGYKSVGCWGEHAMGA